MEIKRTIRRFWARHKRAILVLTVLYFVILILITILASGPQRER